MNSLSDYQFLLNLINFCPKTSDNALIKLLQQWFETIGKDRTLHVVEHYLQHFVERTPHRAVHVLAGLSDDILGVFKGENALADWVWNDRQLSLQFVPDNFFTHTLHDFIPGVATLCAALRWLRTDGDAGATFLPRLLLSLRTSSTGYHAALQLAKEANRLPAPDTWPRRRIAILSDTTIQQLVELLTAGLYFQQISAEVRGGDFQQFEAILLDSASWLYDFQPDMIIIFSSALASPPGKEIPWVKQRISFIHQLIQRLDTHVIVTNFELTPESSGVTGIPDWVYAANSLLRSELPEKASIFDLNALVCECGIDQWFNLNYWNLSRQSCDLHILPRLVTSLSAFIRAIVEPLVKVVVSDLDDTMWGGIVAEVGAEGIVLGGNNEGESYSRYQAFLKGLPGKGFLLAICSKNEEHIARLPFLENRAMALQLGDIAIFKTSFTPKSMMLKEIAHELNIGLQSFLMIDNSLHERQEIREYCPEVQVIPWPDEGITGVPKWLSRFGFVARPVLTPEDHIRTQLYQQQYSREVAQAAFTTQEDFLTSLQLVAHIRPICPANMDRVLQLIEKTNQFNLTTIRHTRKEVDTLLHLPNAYGRVLYLEDKYGPYGLTGVLFAVPDGEWMLIDTFILSCRIMGKMAEMVLFDDLVLCTQQVGMLGIEGLYCPTKKNGSVASLYPDLGFQQVEMRGKDIVFRFECLADYILRNKFIHVFREALA
jgi:FkbH-like protein